MNKEAFNVKVPEHNAKRQVCGSARVGRVYHKPFPGNGKFSWASSSARVFGWSELSRIMDTSGGSKQPDRTAAARIMAAWDICMTLPCIRFPGGMSGISCPTQAPSILSINGEHSSLWQVFGMNPRAMADWHGPSPAVVLPGNNLDDGD
jgi:hypothetical protein